MNKTKSSRERNNNLNIYHMLNGYEKIDDKMQRRMYLALQRILSLCSCEIIYQGFPGKGGGWGLRGKSGVREFLVNGKFRACITHLST